MNAHHAFRSHLMQQFAAQARNQTRPPLALLSVLSENNNNNHHEGQLPTIDLTTVGAPGNSFLPGASATLGPSSATASPSAVLPFPSSTTTSTTTTTFLPTATASPTKTAAARQYTTNPNVRRRHTDSEVIGGSSFELTSSSTTRGGVAFSTAAPQQQQQQLDDGEEDVSHKLEETLSSSSSYSESATKPLYEASVQAQSLQRLLRTRRSSSRFAPPLYVSSSSSLGVNQECEFYRQALDRAVQCGYQAPNHKRTEPFTFQRLLAPSPATEQLAQIAYEVQLRKQQHKQPSGDDSSSLEQEQQALAAAERKRDKWRQIPAFLVTTVVQDTTMEDKGLHWSGDTNDDLYQLLPYQPPATERALEDYAAACAAVQNALLSLHSENLASKWVTGPMIRTPAFRNLIQAQPDDRVVALIPIGRHVAASQQPVERKLRRTISGQLLLEDLE